jgi:hypothetical protein
VKNKVVLIVATFMLFIIAYACNDVEKSSFEKPVGETKEKKASKPTKAKKKKTSAKNTASDKAKEETFLEKETEDDDDDITASQEKTVIRNILLTKINNYAAQNDMSTQYCFLVDMSLPSGKNRFFIYDLKKNSLIHSGLVAHGSCNETFLSRPRFSNETKGGCSSLGKYKVGEFYRGKYGRSFRLYGLDNCNSNAFKRAVVIHGYDCVPNEEIYPRVLCNSFGCPMVSYKFLDKISAIIGKAEKPIVLWIYQ